MPYNFFNIQHGKFKGGADHFVWITSRKVGV